jgi:hypothetical protein
MSGAKGTTIFPPEFTLARVSAHPAAVVNGSDTTSVAANEPTQLAIFIETLDAGWRPRWL